MNFNNHFTIENFKELYIFSNNNENIDNAWRNQYYQLIENNFQHQFVNFLKEIRDTTGLLKIAYAEGHNTYISKAWNQLIDKKNDEEDRNYKTISDAFYSVLSEGLYKPKDEPINNLFIQTKYDKFIETINKGNFNHYKLSEDSCLCHDCGQRIKIVIKDWVPSFGIFKENENGSLDYKTLVPPKSCIPDTIMEIKVNFPTGEIIVSDWIKIEEFTKSVEYNGADKHKDETDINFIKGRIFTTKYHAEKHNIVHVVVGQSPYVFQNGNNLVVGLYTEEYRDYEELDALSDYKQAMRVSTQLRAVTMVDKQTLIDIVSTKSGENATSIVEQHLKNNKECKVINVEPGDYTLKFHGKYYKFNEKVDDKSLPKEVETFFTLSNHKLKNELRPKRKIK